VVVDRALFRVSGFLKEAASRVRETHGQEDAFSLEVRGTYSSVHTLSQLLLNGEAALDARAGRSPAICDRGRILAPGCTTMHLPQPARKKDLLRTEFITVTQGALSV
jgi:hypothetical protein